MLALTEKQLLIKALGEFVCDEIQLAVKPIHEKIKELETAVSVIPSVEQIQKFIKIEIDALPKPLDGVPGQDGKDGRDGVDGQNLSLDDVRDCLSDLVAKAVASLPVPRHCTGGYIDRDGNWVLAFSDGAFSNLGPIVGKDGQDCDMEMVRTQVAGYLATIEKPKDGKDGKDGVGFDDLNLDYDGERMLTFQFIRENGIVKSWEFNLPIPLMRDAWKKGNYKRGDVVWRQGVWVATKDTSTEPGLPDSDWKLCIRKPRDGNNGSQGPPGPEGKAGRNGRDLTHVGLDGSKW